MAFRSAVNMFFFYIYLWDCFNSSKSKKRLRKEHINAQKMSKWLHCKKEKRRECLCKWLLIWDMDTKCQFNSCCHLPFYKKSTDMKKKTNLQKKKKSIAKNVINLMINLLIFLHSVTDQIPVAGHWIMTVLHRKLTPFDI